MTNCYQFVVNGTGAVYQPTCTTENCAKWLQKRQRCADLDIALALNSIRYVANMQLSGRTRNSEDCVNDT